VTVGPGDWTADAEGHGRLRASHADREQTIDALKAAFVQGRLTKDEFDLRIGRALASRTCADLASLTADIPASPATRPPRPTREPARRPARHSNAKRAAAATVACALAAAPTIGGVAEATQAGAHAVRLVFMIVLACLLATPAAGIFMLSSLLGKHSSRPVRTGSAKRRRHGIAAPGADQHD
jgi:DUF1707 SHOCT-like domain